MTLAAPTVQLPYGPHWKTIRTVPGLTTVRPGLLEDLATAVASIVELGTIMLLTAESGIGKTYMLARAIEQVVRDGDLPFLLDWLEFSDWARGATLLRELREQFYADGMSRARDTAELRRDLRRALGEPRRLLVLDEAQHVSPSALLMLAKLIDHPDTNFSLVIVATPAIMKKYPAELKTRTTLPFGLEPLADREVAGALAEFHPLFATANPKLLRSFNRTDADGKFRWWCDLLGLWWLGRTSFGNVLSDEILEQLADTLAGRTRS